MLTRSLAERRRQGGAAGPDQENGESNEVEVVSAVSGQGEMVVVDGLERMKEGMAVAGQLRAVQAEAIR